MQFLGLSSHQSLSSLQSSFLLHFAFLFTPVPDYTVTSDVRKDSLRSPSVYCRTLATKAGLPFSVFPAENPMCIFSPGSFLYSIMAANSVLWYSLLIFHLFSFLLSLTQLCKLLTYAAFLATPTPSSHRSLENIAVLSHPDNQAVPSGL